MSVPLPRGERLAPLLTGLLLVLSFPPFDLFVLPFVALVPLLLYIADRAPGRTGRWRALRAGYLAGLVYFGLLLYWMVVALIGHSVLAIPAYLLTVALLAGLVAAFAAGVHFVRERLPTVPLALSTAVFWTAFEWLRANLGDLSFPWLGLGTALAAVPRAAGAADLVGARGLAFWLVAVNGLIAAIALRLRARRPVAGRVAVAALIIALPIGYGFWRAETLEPRPVARVAVVQPNISEDVKLGTEAVDSSLTALTKLTRRIAPGRVDLVVWPEVALPIVLSGPDLRHVRERIRRLSTRVGAPIVAGAYGAERGRDGRTRYNSAFLATPGGTVDEVYRKRHLVPFVERVPFVDPDWLQPFTGELRRFATLGRGQAAPALGAPGAERFGVAICYESIFGSLARRLRLAGADYLVNITNDAWFGGEAWYARTTALWQHPAHLVLRAIENRVGIARAANTGISMFVDPLGRTYAVTELFEPAVRVATVYTTDERTLFTRWGDWVATGAAGVAVLLLLAGRFGVERVAVRGSRGAACSG